MSTQLPQPQEWLLVTFYEWPPTAGNVSIYREVVPDEASARAKLADYQANGFSPSPLSWECNWVAPANVRGFAVIPNQLVAAAGR